VTYIFHVFRSFLPMHNPIGFGASDLVLLSLAILLCGGIALRALLASYLRRVAGNTALSMCLLFGVAIVLRLSLLPAPVPSGADDFSFILLGDTLRHLRMANAPHPLHQFFEAVFVLQQPTYSSIYPLGQGLILAIGWMLFQSFWAGVLIASGAFAALCYWMLRGWVAPQWALLGGLLAVVQFGPLCPWVNSYWGGYVSACAGCLVFGAMPRRSGWLLGAGLALQILTRPFEALFLGLLAIRHLDRRSLSLVAAALALTAVQNKAVTGSWTTLPYVLSRSQYGVPTTFTFQPNPKPHRALTAEQQLDYRAQSAIHEEAGGYWQRLAYRFRFVRFFFLPPLLFAALWAGRKFAWAAGAIVLFALGTNFYPYFFPHYLAAIACLAVLLSVAGLQRLSAETRAWVLAPCFAFFAFWFGIYLLRDSDLLPAASYQSWYYMNRGDPQGRIAVQEMLDRAPGRHLVFVRYSAAHRFEEWIHNRADIDSSRTVWANDLGPVENEKLLRYYPNRTAWLLQPDVRPPALMPYSQQGGAFETVR
jgi:hypothetical protein